MKDMNSEDPSAAMGLQIFSSLRVLEYATVAKADGLDLRIDGGFSAPEMAGMLKPMIDNILPQASQIGPLVLGLDLPCLKTLKSYAKGNHVGISANLVQADVDALIKFVKEQAAARLQMNEEADSAIDALDDDDDDE